MTGNNNGGERNGNAVPAPRDTGGEAIRVRKGMFGANNGGDTSGYGGLIRTITLPGAASRPYGGWFDEVADELEGALEEQDLLPEHAIEHT
ncbi:NADH-quinone oxidoreductase subunit C, partial [Streptomyces sp. SID8455]|nr:NADH-quinone oxidoreductase subunit C [Streptomyces sp. SID8455]